MDNVGATVPASGAGTNARSDSNGTPDDSTRPTLAAATTGGPPLLLAHSSMGAATGSQVESNYSPDHDYPEQSPISPPVLLPFQRTRNGSGYHARRINDNANGSNSGSAAIGCESGDAATAAALTSIVSGISADAANTVAIVTAISELSALVTSSAAGAALGSPSPVSTIVATNPLLAPTAASLHDPLAALPRPSAIGGLATADYFTFAAPGSPLTIPFGAAVVPAGGSPLLSAIFPTNAPLEALPATMLAAPMPPISSTLGAPERALPITGAASSNWMEDTLVASDSSSDTNCMGLYDTLSCPEVAANGNCCVSTPGDLIDKCVRQRFVNDNGASVGALRLTTAASVALPSMGGARESTTLVGKRQQGTVAVAGDVSLAGSCCRGGGAAALDSSSSGVGGGGMIDSASGSPVLNGSGNDGNLHGEATPTATTNSLRSSDREDEASSHHQRLNLLDPQNPRSAIERDIIKIIGQHLRSLGLHRAASTLSEESACSLDHPLAAKLQNHVMGGQLDEAIMDLTELEPFLIGSDAVKRMRFLLLEQKFLELLGEGKTMQALFCLRHQLSPLKHDVDRVHHLSSYLLMPQSCCAELELYRSDILESRNGLMERLQRFLPASIMLPPRRLRSLLAKAQAYQIERCKLHNQHNAPCGPERGGELLENISLLSDHQCDKNDFPCYTTQILSDHCDEIWVCQWSHDGLCLATGSKDSTVILWDLDVHTKLLSPRRTLDGHTYGVSCLAWSPDDALLLVCGYEDSSDLWIWDTHTGELRQKMSHSADDSLTTCAWQAVGAGSSGGSSRRFVCGGTRGQFYQCDVEGRVLDSWEGVRLHGLHCLSDGRTVLAADSHHRIKSYNFDYMHDENIVVEDYSIMSFTVDSKDRFALLNLAQQGLHLWDIRDKTLLMKYRGITQGYYTIHSCFGGVGEKFIASGSEDNKVYIFNRSKETPIAILEGHTRTVNCVAWNPRFPSLLASVSDDANVRLWGPPPSSAAASDCGLDFPSPLQPPLSLTASSDAYDRVLQQPQQSQQGEELSEQAESAAGCSSAGGSNREGGSDESPPPPPDPADGNSSSQGDRTNEIVAFV